MLCHRFGNAVGASEPHLYPADIGLFILYIVSIWHTTQEILVRSKDYIVYRMVMTQKESIIKPCELLVDESAHAIRHEHLSSAEKRWHTLPECCNEQKHLSY